LGPHLAVGNCGPPVSLGWQASGELAASERRARHSLRGAKVEPKWVEMWGSQIRWLKVFYGRAASCLCVWGGRRARPKALLRPLLVSQAAEWRPRASGEPEGAAESIFCDSVWAALRGALGRWPGRAARPPASKKRQDSQAAIDADNHAEMQAQTQ